MTVAWLWTLQVLMTNVASACGYTAGNYKELVALQDKYAGKGLVRSTCPFPGALAGRPSLTRLGRLHYCTGNYRVALQPVRPSGVWLTRANLQIHC